MSQTTVERVLGRLLTDEAFRRNFADDGEAALLEIVRNGCKLNECEFRALLSVEPEELERFAAHLDPCIQKAELSGPTTQCRWRRDPAASSGEN